MFVLTLELNNECNLNCSYCYKGEKDNSFMKLKTAQNAVIYAISVVKKQHQDQTIKINFLGGEPLISFQILKQIIEFCDKYNHEIKFIYTITTNGLLLNEVIIDYLIEKRVRIKISLDGNKNINDINRVDYTGLGSYNRVINKFDLLHKYENLSQIYVQVSNVITKNNYQYLSNSIEHNISKGFRYLDTGIDFTEEWNCSELDLMEDEILKAIKYYIDFNINYDSVVWTFFDKIVSNNKPVDKLYFCGAGISSLYILPDGTVYPCLATISTGLEIGNINECVSLDLVNQFINNLNNKNKDCSQCQYEVRCKTKRCFAINLDKEIKLDCWFTKLSNKILLKYIDILKRNSCFSRYKFL